MLLSGIGEFGLIERFKKSLKTDSSVIKGSGDDCAVIKFNKDKYLLFTCDMIVEGVDFTSRDRLQLVGRKALAVSISDIAACAGIPRYAVVSLGMPKSTTLRIADKITQGMFGLAREYKVNIVGGDISSSGQLTIDVGMLGFVEKRYLVLRSGARGGDIIFVTGELGGSLYGKHLKFIPRLKEARFLVKKFKINAMIDISDGLVQDLSHILKASRLGAILYETLIPVSKHARNPDEALYMGEDFELLFTLSHNAAKRLLRDNPLHFKPIGQIVEEKRGLIMVTKDGREKIIQPRGFTHF